MEKRLNSIPGADDYREYDYDPKNPVRSHGGETILRSWDEGGSLEQPEPDWREDVLSYISEPFEEKRDIVGKICVDLWVESSAPDTCFTVKVMEVFEDGRAFNIRNGITTLGYRNDSSSRQKYEGGPVEIQIKTWDIAWQMQKGSRLRLDISSSNFPEYSVHPNTEKEWALEACPQIAHQKVLSGEKYPSRLILPILSENRE